MTRYMVTLEGPAEFVYFVEADSREEAERVGLQSYESGEAADQCNLLSVEHVTASEGEE